MENTATLEGKKVGMGMGIVVVLALIALFKGKEVAAAVKLPEGEAASAAARVEQAKALTTEQAEAIVASPTQVIAANQTFVATHPTAYSMVEQANIQIAAGLASAGDILRFEIDKAYYVKHVAEGGTASYEDFTSYTEHWTPEYRAAKQEVKDKVASRDADETEAIHYYVTDAYGEVVGTDPERLAEYIARRSPTSPERLELERRHPELVPKEEPAPAPEPEPEPTPEPTSAYAAAVAAAVKEATVPDDFTATKSQLDNLVSSGVSKDSSTYKEAVDYSYAKAASEAKSSGGVVSWSSDGGYKSISNEEACSNPDYW